MGPMLGAAGGNCCMRNATRIPQSLFAVVGDNEHDSDSLFNKCNSLDGYTVTYPGFSPSFLADTARYMDSFGGHTA